ncbi:MAG: CDP-glycerol glycerophosphotransferase family protein [Clostridium sp.]|nr:CDP-glycerol glycerophosphotransferase family protein [Clostridium sp.]
MIRRICKWIVFKWVYPVVYFIGCFRSVRREKIIFVENHEEQLSGNFGLLYDRLEQKNYKIAVHYLRVSVSSWSKVIFRTIYLIWDMATANCVFLSESNSVFGAFTLRKETKLVQLWHACGAFKKWGYSVAEKSFGDDKKALDTYKGHRNYDLVSVSGEAVCWAYEEAFGLQKDAGVVKALGVSRTDVYFNEEKRQQAYLHLNSLQFPIEGRRVILYAPTFRGDIRHAKAPEEFNLHILYELHKEYVILVKNHPFVKESMKIPEEYADFCIEVANQMSIEELLMVADICITDYSSVIFEYSLMQRPILFFAYDLEEYYDERGFYYPYDEFVPGPIVRTATELVREIKQIDQFDMDKLKVFFEKYMSGCDGHSTKRILEYVLEEAF